ncbi:MAG: single-stranded-DNA-specific exonuclease RecJ [Oscillospiraceae bacterium]|nr:single-stranded-DNA-specific exonuclease RecJ [Oscillospiraceae bacterium]
MTVKRWRVSAADENAVETLRGELGLKSLAARVLAARGCTTRALALELLKGEARLERPLALKDMEKAALRINEAIGNDEIIAVFGDYDVDGLSSGALMLSYLQSRGARVLCALPSRDSEGYGLSKKAVASFKRRGASLLITVDNGISAHEEIAYANSLGLEVIVSDHHLPAETLPPAFAVVDPLRADDESSFKSLAGVGVALKLAAAVEGCEPEELLDEYGWLAALGTVADVMPLKGENRTIVKRGLESLKYCESPGLALLAEGAGASLESMSARDVAFTLAPRLNAAGRMEGAETALALLISEDPEEAAALAIKLEALNAERREAEALAAEKVEASLAESPNQLRRPLLILSGEGLHSGVTGIVCSRLLERFGKPVIIISVENGTARGSGRAAGGMSLHSAIASAAPLLIKYGGHDMAAGFMLKTEDIESFKESLYAYCRECETPPALPSINIDAEIPLSEISEAAVEELAALAPFGHGFEEPVFLARNLTVTAAAPINGRHSRLTLGGGGRTLSGAWFNHKTADLPFKAGDSVDAVFSLSIYEGAAKRSVSVRFLDVFPAGLNESACESLGAYRELCAERPLKENERAQLALNREDIAAVYRLIKKEALDRANLPKLASLFPSLGTGRALAALDVLEELNLIETLPDKEGRYLASAAEGAKKRGLEESALFCELAKEWDAALV